MALELAVSGLRAGYGSLEVLHGIDLAVPHGRVTGLLGPNGAGKTTLLRTIAGSVTPRSGAIRWRGEDITRWPAEVRAGRGMVAIPADEAVFPSLTVRDNLVLFAAGHPLQPALDTFPALASRLDQRAGTLSGGEQRMLALSRAVLVDPVLLLVVDEPSLGLSAELTEQIYRVIEQVAGRGVTVLLTDQHQERVMQLAAVIYDIEHGEVVFTGEPGELPVTT